MTAKSSDRPIDAVAVAQQLGHQAVVPPRLRTAPAPLSDTLRDRFRTSSVPDVSDTVGRLFTMDSGIRPLYEPIERLAGAAVTVRLPPGDNWALAAALAGVRRNDVLVVDWMGYRDGCGTGVNTLIPAILRGLRGVVIDGSWRDIAEIEQLGFPVFGRGITPFSPPKHEMGEINVPVCCGGVIVEPGDIIVADREGAVVVPRRYAQEVSAALPEGEYAVPESIDEYPARSASAERRSKAFFDLYGQPE